MVQHQQTLESSSGQWPTRIRVESSAVLERETVRSLFVREFQEHSTLRSVGVAALQLTSGEQETQHQALEDCFALGRSDPRVLILIRHMMANFRGQVLRHAIVLLSHATSHPDILYTENNWIPRETADVLMPHLVWTLSEIRKMIALTRGEEWNRGSMFQCIYSILCVDPMIEPKMEKVAKKFLETGKQEDAFWCMYLCLYWAGERGLEKYDEFCEQDIRFADHALTSEIVSILEEHGQLTLFE